MVAATQIKKKQIMCETTLTVENANDECFIIYILLNASVKNTNDVQQGNSAKI